MAFDENDATLIHNSELHFRLSHAEITILAQLIPNWPESFTHRDGHTCSGVEGRFIP